MSTFKKVLALTLALAMVLSVSAFAGYSKDAYKDSAAINEDCEEAVELMYALEIMKGDNNGNFNPEATITRAEMAKMIYVILNYGKDDLAVNYKGAKIFSDVNQTLALGGITFGVRNIELNAALSTIANGGEYIVPRLYTKVTMVNESRDSHGGVTEAETVLLDNTNPEKERVLKKTTCWLLTSAMKDVVKEPGTGTPAYFSTTAIAGKYDCNEQFDLTAIKPRFVPSLSRCAGIMSRCSGFISGIIIGTSGV